MSQMTIYKLAKELHMTPTMVSRAFNPNARVSEEKRRLVLETAKKYQFSPNKHASRLSMKPLRIGILLCSRSDVNTKKMIRAVEEGHDALCGYKVEYDIACLNCHDSLDKIQEVLEKYKAYDGVLVSGMSAPHYTDLLNDFYEINPNIVQVQSQNHEARCLFASKHDEARASAIASDFLYQCLRRGERKNILLFTGDLQSTVHHEASVAFRACCERAGMRLLDVIDMRDDEKYFEEILPAVFKKYIAQTDGIYITSGLSIPLCHAIEERGIDIPLVTFDTHDGIREYMERGIVYATISQNVKGQMRVAFETLVSHIITAEPSAPILYTEVQIKLPSNIR